MVIVVLLSHPCHASANRKGEEWMGGCLLLHSSSGLGRVEERSLHHWQYNNTLSELGFSDKTRSASRASVCLFCRWLSVPFFPFFVQKDDEENKHRKGKKRERCCSSNTAVQTAPKPRHTGMDACKNTCTSTPIGGLKLLHGNICWVTQGAKDPGSLPTPRLKLS